MISVKIAQVLFVVVALVFVNGMVVIMSNKIINGTIKKAKVIGNTSLEFSKKFLRKRAIKIVNENIAYQQKAVVDYSKEELRTLILNEEKKIIKSLAIHSLLLFAAAFFGISKIK